MFSTPKHQEKMDSSLIKNLHMPNNIKLKAETKKHKHKNKSPETKFWTFPHIKLGIKFDSKLLNSSKTISRVMSLNGHLSRPAVANRLKQPT